MARKDSDQARRAVRKQLGVYQAKAAAFEAGRKRRKRDNVLWGSIAGGVVAIAIASQAGFALTGAHPAPSPTQTRASGVPSPALAQGKTWSAALGINGVTLTLTLDGAHAPQAVSSTLQLANKGFYSGLACHRLTTSGIFVLQCGDPKGDGTGGPGYSYGPIENAPANNLYKAGVIAMARQGNNASSQGSQFFIVYSDSTIPSDSAGGYTVIGSINGGLDKLIAKVTSKGTSNGSSDGAPKVSTKIDSFNILPN